MRVLKEDSPPELLLQKIEELLCENNAQIIVGSYNELFLSIDDSQYKIYNLATESESTQLPRFLDEERLLLVE